MHLHFWQDREKDADVSVQEDRPSQESAIKDGNDKYVVAEGINSTSVTYQDASGAPVETNSPLGYFVSFWTSLCLNINQMIGTGIFSTPASILQGVGSVGLSMIYWFIGYLLSHSTLALYLELASYFPSRSGSEVVYLEQAYPKPEYLFPTTFAVKHVVFSFGSSNAVVFAEYIFGIAGSSYTNWQLKGVAVATYTVALIVVGLSTKWSLRIVVWFGFIKIATLLLISIAGLVVLGGHTRVEDPMINWRNAWEGTSQASAYGATNAMVKLIFSYSGYTNAFSVVNEIKNPVKTLRWSAPFSLILVTVLYILVNVAYFSAASREEILNSKQIAAGIFFQKIFGTSNGASRALNVLVCISAFGNLIAVMINNSRMLRETGRQGVLPWPRFWTSTRPFGTPLGPYVVQWATTVIMILGPPAGDAFNFVVDLSVYPSTIFNFLLVGGLLLIRWRRKKLNLPQPEYKSWMIAIGFALLTNIYLLAAPWYPPTTGANGGDISFWYGTYLVVGIGLLACCGIYYFFWIKLIPGYKKYEFRQNVLEFDDGSIAHSLVKVPYADLARWDEEHDAIGRVRHRVPYESDAATN
ncbi:amino acid permease-domain-containing protein [Aspergillus avenaceus]|uniref:Amino acid permease-domain-containing protein n=1 Tax=Aspergillus avenaceus TaxID=36643 RepID=A0A5N6TM23_ASPAV|nr:amino acid permease-domain-containing protein [Aspergillus avenaceus]